jgi:MerR family transcriptional regulator, heat shock protein HspR
MEDPTAPLYSVGQVATMLGLQHAFLRRLDSEQVVCPSRSPGGQRRYSRDEVDRVDRVASLMDDGVTLASIRHILLLEAEVADLRRQLAVATRMQR